MLTPAGALATLLLDLALLAAARPDTLPLRAADGVRDPVFAILIGLAEDHHTGEANAERLREGIRATGRSTKLPLALFDGVTRLPVPGDSTSVAVEARFTHELDLPVPYRILTYHPGSFRGSQRLLFREIDLGAVSLHHDDYVDRRWTSRQLPIEEARLYLLESGGLAIDIDGWLDTLAGEKLDDTRVAGLVVFRMAGALYGTALGYNRKGEPRSGTLAFADDRLIYPNTPELKTISRFMRAQMERLAPQLKPVPAVSDQ